MDQLTKERRPFRAQLTKLITELSTLLQDEQPDKNKIHIKIDRMVDIRGKVAECDEKILRMMGGLDVSDDDLGKEIQAVEEYEEKFQLCKLEGERLLEPQRPTSPVNSEYETSASSFGEKKRSFKLPKIELIKFNGDLKDWLGFWSQFEKIHEDETLHDSDKFIYLLQAMEKGTEARDIVESYPQTGNNYSKAVESLKNRFGDSDLLLQVYVREILKLVISNVTSTERLPLTTLYIKLESNLRALATLQLSSADPATWLYPLVESSLHEETSLAWQRSPIYSYDGSKDTPPKTRLDLLMEFLKSEIQIKQRINLAQAGFRDPQQSWTNITNATKKRSTKAENEDSPPTAAGLFNAQASNCVFCDLKHESKACGNAKKLTYEEKRKKVQDKNACFNCLKRGHSSRNCRSFVSCLLCPKKHHTIMCPSLESKACTDGVSSTEKTEEIDGTTLASQSNIECSGDILMKTVVVNLSTQNGRKTMVRLLFDEGSQRSYISTKAVNDLRSIPFSSELSRNVLFDGSTTDFQKTNKHKISISSLDEKIKTTLVLRERTKLGGGVPCVPSGPWTKELAAYGIQVTDQSIVKLKHNDIDIIIGSEHWNQLMTGKMVKLKGGLGANESIFGWTLSGPLPNPNDNHVVDIISMYCAEEEVPKLWNLEVIGIRDVATKLSEKEEEEQAKKIFFDTTTRTQDGRYCVRLPWMNGSRDLPSNYNAAERRLRSTTCKLEEKGKYEEYNNIFNSWLSEGFIEIVPCCETNKSHYLPHHPVFKDSITTPVRPVFDASCKTGRNPSLNDCLYKGPNWIELIPSVLIRFREKKIGVTADIRKAFQMLEICSEDRNYLRFLWWEVKGERIITYRHSRVVFGVNCSPFLLSAVIDMHLRDVNENKDVSEILRRSMYVDNLVTSVETFKEYTTFKDTSIKLFSLARMELRQWEHTLNGPGIVEPSGWSGLGPGILQHNLDLSSKTKVLGLIWDKETDTISLEPPSVTTTEYCSKRTILSLISKIFDPIGFSAPALVMPKLLLQKAWTQKLGWDEKLPEEYWKNFSTWLQEIKFLFNIQIPRQAFTYNNQLELHTFCDGSWDAYAAVVFLRSSNGIETAVQLISAKSRIAPVARMTTPRLELLACVIGARLLASVRESLRRDDIPVYMWSDSTTAIAWIQRNDEWGTFIGNRVRNISSLTNANQWSHVPGKLNPADLPSRGCSPKELFQSRWWEGPSWLKTEKYTWPNSNAIVNEELVNSERKKTSISMQSTEEKSWFSPQCSSFSKRTKIMAYVLRFITNTRAKPGYRTVNKYFSKEEWKLAEIEIFKIIQGESYPDMKRIKGLVVVTGRNGLLRVETSLVYREDADEFKMPVLLPGKHPWVGQIIMEAHFTHNHAKAQVLMGKLRERLWITQTRRSITKAIKLCFTCQRFDAKPCVVKPAPLPTKRVTDGEVFSTTGVDLAGPLFLRDGSKVWFVIFTCAVYRCVVLDLVVSLDTTAFVQALERFISLFGRPTTLYSDNGTNFTAASNLFARMNWERIEEVSHTKQINWVFNPPTAAWWGGFWERLIKSIKDLLCRMLGKAKLNFEELRTCLAAVSSTINERPLTTVTEDPNDLMPLTPAMFLKGTKGSQFPEGNNIKAKDLRGRYKKIKQTREAITARFRKEYLALLVRKPVKEMTNICVGKLVLIGADNKKRFDWPLGRVLELIPGKDNRERVAKVKTMYGVLTRPLQRLYPLEVPEYDGDYTEMISNDRKTSVDVGTEELRTRSGRLIRKPNNYGSWNF